MEYTTVVYFQDLGERLQLALWEEIRAMLLATGWIEPRRDEEEFAEFEQRVHEEVDHYLNTHNRLSISL
jgi:hypothetical protein